MYCISDESKFMRVACMRKESNTEAREVWIFGRPYWNFRPSKFPNSSKFYTFHQSRIWPAFWVFFKDNAVLVINQIVFYFFVVELQLIYKFDIPMDHLDLYVCVHFLRSISSTNGDLNMCWKRTFCSIFDLYKVVTLSDALGFSPRFLHGVLIRSMIF